MDDGFWRMEGMGISLRVDADDDRLHGAGSARSISSKYPFPVEVQAGIYDFANEDGRWVGTVAAFVEPTLGIDRDTVILSGEGAYDGLSAYLLIDWSDLPAEFIGAMFPGEMPRIPIRTARNGRESAEVSSADRLGGRGSSRCRSMPTT